MTEEEKRTSKKIFGLLGKNISYSFSSGYFSEKFTELNLNGYSYLNFDLESIQQFHELLNKHMIHGMNVTIPYKEEIIDFLDEIDQEAKEIGAVNTIKFSTDGKLIGFNTDVYGFRKSIASLLEDHHTKALILGTGGASKAIAYALNSLGIATVFVSRTPNGLKEISYMELTSSLMASFTLIINCTPVGTFPETNLYPAIPYQYITSKHLLYDLIYNPSQTEFLKKGKNQGAVIKNGLEMLQLQAEKSWVIWNQ